MWRILLLFLFMVDRVLMQSAPAHCSYIENNLFSCDYTAMTSSSDRPIDYNSFNPEPQRIELIVDGLVPFFGDTRVFSSSFANIDTTSFTENYPATLTFDCEGSDVYISDGAFSNMSYVQQFTIRHCNILDLPADIFSGFENLDSFIFEGGTIDTIDVNAFVGLSVEKLSSDDHVIPRNLGKFEFQYTKFSGSEIPAGILYNMKNLTTIVFRGNGVNTLSSDLFRYNTKLKHIDMSDNEFTSIPDKLFDNLLGLSEIRMENIEWDCTCSNAWFVPYVTDRNISFYGDNICANIYGYTVFEYYYDNCVSTDPCDGIIGFTIGSICQTVLGLIIFILALIACAVVIVTLIMIVVSTKSYKTKDKKRRQAIGRWNQVIDRTIGQSKKL